MNGRLEEDIKLNKVIESIVSKNGDLIRDYADCFSEAKTLKTKMNYIYYVSEFINYYNGNILNLTSIDINKYMKSIKYRTDKEGNQTQNGNSIRATKLYAIKDFYNFLVNAGLISSNPCVGVEIPRENNDKEVVYMTESEINIIKNNILNGVGSHNAKARQENWKYRDLAIFILGCSTGLRVSAISQINVSDINFDELYISVVEKGNKKRNVYFGENTKDALMDWLTDREEIMKGIDEDALFVSSQKRRINTKTISQLISKYSEGLSKHITPHKMRSTCGSNLYERTGDIYMTATMLGHKNISNTRKYAKVSKEKQKIAADVLNSLF